MAIVAIPLIAFMPWSGTKEPEEIPTSAAEPTPLLSPSPILTLAPEPEETEYIAGGFRSAVSVRRIFAGLSRSSGACDAGG